MPKPDNVPTEGSVSAAVVLHHSDLDNLRATLTSVARAVDALGVSTPLYLIDQSRDPQYGAAVRALVSDLNPVGLLRLDYIAREKNGGYGAGHNSVLDDSLGDIHFILNPDVELPEELLIRVRQTMADHPDVVVLAPRGANSEGEEEYLAKRYPTCLVLLIRAFAPDWLQRRFEKQMNHYELRDLPSDGSLQDVPLLSGCCLAVRSDSFRAVRGFDEGFFLYFEDYDLCMRLRSEGRVVRDPGLQVIHHGGQAARKGWQHILWFARGGLRFFSLWGWRWV